MQTFTITELLLVVTVVGLTAGGIAVSSAENRAVATGVAVCLGLTIAGPPLLWWRRRSGSLKGKWGIGEILWCLLGLYFVPLVLFNIAVPSQRAASTIWLFVACVMGTALLFAAAIVGGVRWLTPRSRDSTRAQRPWFCGRWTNVAGMVLVVLYTAGFCVILSQFGGF